MNQYYDTKETGERMKHLQALLQGKCTSHILPFLG